MSEDSDPSDDALESLYRRLAKAARAAGPLDGVGFLQMEVLLYIAREVHELRSLIDAIDRGRSEW